MNESIPLFRPMLIAVCLMFATVSAAQSLDASLGMIDDSPQRAAVTRLLAKYRSDEAELTDALKQSVQKLAIQFRSQLGDVGSKPYTEQATALNNWLITGGDFPMANDYIDLVFQYATGI